MPILKEVDFAGRALGQYSNPAFFQDWGINPTCSSGGNPSAGCGNSDKGHRLNIVQNPANSDPNATVLQVTYLADMIGGSNTAMVFDAPFELPADYTNQGIWFQYRVMFDNNFKFTRGGKLPGLATSDVPTGCVPLPDPDLPGSTTRRMWHYYDPQLVPEGRFVLTSYLYHQQKEESCGDYFMMCRTSDGQIDPPQMPINPNCETPQFLQAGQWYVLTQFVRLNNFSATGESLQDGVVVEFIAADDPDAPGISSHTIIELNNLELRTRPDVVMDKIAMQTFFGGSTINWAPSENQFVYFDKFLVSTDVPPDIHLSQSQISRLGIKI